MQNLGPPRLVFGSSRRFGVQPDIIGGPAYPYPPAQTGIGYARNLGPAFGCESIVGCQPVNVGGAGYARNLGPAFGYAKAAGPAFGALTLPSLSDPATRTDIFTFLAGMAAGILGYMGLRALKRR